MCMCMCIYVCMYMYTHADALKTQVEMYEMRTCISMYTRTHVHTITHTCLPLIVLVQMDGDAGERSKMRASNMGGSNMQVVEAEPIHIHTLAAGETLPHGAVVVTSSATLSSAQEHPRRERPAHTGATHLEKAVKRSEAATLGKPSGLRAKAQGGAATAPTPGSKGLVTVEQRLGAVNHDSHLSHLTGVKQRHVSSSTKQHHDSHLTPVKQHHLTAVKQQHLKDAQQQKLMFARTTGTHLAFVSKLQVARHSQ